MDGDGNWVELDELEDWWTLHEERSASAFVLHQGRWRTLEAGLICDDGKPKQFLGFAIHAAGFDREGEHLLVVNETHARMLSWVDGSPELMWAARLE